MKYYCIRLVDIFTKFIIAGFIALVILLATAVSLVRYYLPLVEDYHFDILKIINDRTESFDINANMIRANIDGISPEIELYGVTVTAKGHDEIISVDELRLSVDLIRTLSFQRLFFERLSLSNLDLFLVQSDKKLWGLRTVASESTSKPLKVQTLVEQLWSIDKFSIKHIRVNLNSFDHPPIQLPEASLDIVTNKNAKKLSFVVHHHSSLEPLVELYALADYSPYDKRFQFKSDVLMNDLKLNQYLPMLSSQYGLNEFNVSAKTSLHYKDQLLVAEGFIDVNGLSYDLNKAGIDELILDDIDTELYLSISKQQQLLSFNNSVISKAGQKITIPHAQFSIEQLKKSLYLDTVNAGEVTRFVELIWPKPDHKAINFVHGLNISGRLNHIHAVVENNQWDQFSLVAKADKLNSEFYKNIPAIQQASGELSISALHGQFDIDAKNFGLHLQQVFAEGFKLDNARGLLKWNIYDDESEILKRLSLKGENLQFDGDIGYAEGEFILDLPLKAYHANSKFSPPTLSLQIGIDDTSAEFLPEFLPINLPSNLQTWLYGNIKSADITRADFIYHGSASKFSKLPVVNQLYLDVADGEVNYLADWPSVNNLKGYFRLDNKKVSAAINRASVKDIVIKNASLDFIAPSSNIVKARSGEINIAARYHASLASAYEFLSIKPIEKALSGTLKDWHVKGHNDVQGSIAIKVPLNAVNNNVATASKTSPKVAVTVKAQLRDIDLYHVPQDINLTQVNSNIQFSLSKGLSARSLSFNFFNEPYVGSIQSFSHKGSVYNTRINFNGSLPQSTLSKRFNHPILTFSSGLLKGSGYVYFGNQGSGVKFKSNLEGLALNLPEPFAKTTSEKMPLSFSLPFSGNQRILTAKLNNLANIQFRLGKNGFDAGRIILGIKHAPFEARKIIVGGQVKELNAEEWLDFVLAYDDANKMQGKSLSTEERAAKTLNNSWHIEVDDLLIRRLSAFDQELTRAQLTIRDLISYWDIVLNQEQLKLKARVPLAKKPIQLDIRYADLSFLNLGEKNKITLRHKGVKQEVSTGSSLIAEDVLSAKSESDSQSSPVIKVNQPANDLDFIVSGLASSAMANVPDIDVQINQLMYGEHNYGEWEFEFRAEVNKVTLKHLKGQIRHMQVMGNDNGPAFLSWNLDDKNIRNESLFSLFRGRVSGDNLADVLSAWGYPPQIISQSFIFDLDMKWLGAPTDYKFDAAEGDILASLQKGSFIDMPSSSTSALKFVSALSLSNILRRVKLDFSDLTDKGLTYDTVKGKIHLDDGKVSFDNKPIEIEGSSSNINLLGQADFNQEIMDFELSVTLPLASNLPWVVALAAGLPTAAGVYIISKLLQTQVEKLSSAVYQVSGPFENPKVKFLRLFDSH